MRQLCWEVFLACMLSVLTEDTLRSAQNALTEGHFGLFDGEASTIFFEVSGDRFAVPMQRLAVSPIASFAQSQLCQTHQNTVANACWAA